MMEMEKVDSKYIPLLTAVLDKIRHEMDRLYWNKHQKVMDSPFDNTGTEYVNSTFQVYAYYWGDDELINRPNFQYKDLAVFWYKHSNRGVYAFYKSHKIKSKFLADMLDDCIQSMREDFEEQESGG